MIPESVLSLPSLGAYNTHGSLLPKYRGRAPINWAVLHGEKQAGVTLHAMVKKADAGDIIDQQAVPIGPDDTSAIVQARATQAAVEVLKRQIELLKPARCVCRTSARFRSRNTSENERWKTPSIGPNPRNTSTILFRAGLGTISGAEHDGRKTIVWKTRLTGNNSDAGIFGEPKKIDTSLFVTCDGYENDSNGE